MILSTPIPAGSLVAGRTYRIVWAGRYAATTTQITRFRIRLGTAGTIADTLLVETATPAGGTTAVGFMGEALITVRSSGVSGSVIAMARNTGIPANNNSMFASPAAVTVNTTNALNLSLTAGVAAATANLTFHVASIELVKS